MSRQEAVAVAAEVVRVLGQPLAEGRNGPLFTDPVRIALTIEDGRYLGEAMRQLNKRFPLVGKLSYDTLRSEFIVPLSRVSIVNQLLVKRQAPRYPPILGYTLIADWVSRKDQSTQTPTVSTLIELCEANSRVNIEHTEGVFRDLIDLLVVSDGKIIVVETSDLIRRSKRARY